MNKLRLFFLSVLFLVPLLMISQNTISGVVTEQSTGDPLPGVNITEKDAKNGTITDFDGKYTLNNITEGSTLIFSSIGYDTQNVIATTKIVDVTLVSNVKDLDEVVIIGYGSTTKKDATGSLTKINTKDLKNEGVASPEQMLVGKVAGLTVTPSGKPGGGGTIRIRESTSLFGKLDPLIVIDGVPGGSMFNLNNNDIESFTILKDASATAIYGSRASNGVIIITTKKAKVGKLQYTYNNSFTVKNIVKKIDVLSASEFRNFVNTNGTASDIALLGDANTDWQDEIFDTGRGMNHDFSMSGGSSKLNFRLGLGFATEDGVLKTSNFEKGTYSLNVGSKLFNNKLKIRTSYQFSQFQFRNADQGAIGSAISFDPTQPVHVADQTFGGYFQWLQTNGLPLAVGAPKNPVSLLYQKRDVFASYNGIGNIKFDYELPYIDGLHANFVLGIDHSNGHGTKTTASDTASEVNSDFSNFGYKETIKTSHSNKLLDFYLNYKKNITSINANLDFTAGYSYQDFDNTKIELRNLQNDPNQQVDDPLETFVPLNLQSYFGRLNFNLSNKYLFTVSYRRDGSSRFYDSSETWIDVPSAAFAWKISEESFMSGSKFSNLKLRLGWGITGQQDIPPAFPGLATYLNSTSTAQYQLGDEFVTTSRPQPYNPLLKWENTTTYNLGIDYGILDNKINGSVELFHRKSEDLLNRLPFPAGSSLSNEDWANIGNLENQGVEFTINYKAIERDDFRLNFGFNTTYNKLEITQLTAASDDSFNIETSGITGGVGNTIQVHTVGYTPYSFYVYQQVYDNAGNPIEGVYVDRNNDGVIDSDDKYRFKKPNADVTFGFNTNLEYKKFDFNMFWRGSLGNYVYNNVDSQHGFQQQMLNESFPEVINNGVQNAVETGFQNGGAQRYLSDYYVQDASFVKLDNLTIGYTFDKLKRIKRVRFYASVQNVFTITDYKGVDPETVYKDGPEGTKFSGVNYNIYPRTRSFAFGMNLNF